MQNANAKIIGTKTFSEALKLELDLLVCVDSKEV
jgi:hypothetical protein